MEIVYLEQCESTQLYLKQLLNLNRQFEPLLVYTHRQTDGIGSRGNNWDGYDGNLFFSFAMHKSNLPNDLMIQSASIYFSYLLKEILQEFGSDVWMKWPNDFYLKDKKIGGTITTLSGDIIICGIGINLHKSELYDSIDISFDVLELLKIYIANILKKKAWKEVFIKYEIEFSLSKNQNFHSNGLSVSMADAVLNCDGSIEINNQKVYSLR